MLRNERRLFWGKGLLVNGKKIKIMKKRYLFPIGLLAIVLLGPKAEFEAVAPKITPIDIPLHQMDDYIRDQEASVKNIKPNNESRIIWADSIQKTEYVVVYLHGFSAGIWEGDGVHTQFAKRYGTNLYLARLEGHGISGKDVFKNLTPKNFVESAKKAIAIGQLLGEKIILMSCSTGSTHAIYLAAHNPEMVHAQIMYSPNIALVSSAASLLTMPWGRQIAGALVGDYIKTGSHGNPIIEKINTTIYSTNGIIALENFIEQTMTDETFSKITQPYFLGYYYKNEEEQDPVVSVPAMLDMANKTATSDNQKRLVPFANVNTHVVPSVYFSKDIETVRQATFQYAEEVLGMKPVK